MAHVDLKIVPSSPPNPAIATPGHAAAGIDPSLPRLECGAPLEVRRWYVKGFWLPCNSVIPPVAALFAVREYAYFYLLNCFFICFCWLVFADFSFLLLRFLLRKIDSIMIIVCLPCDNDVQHELQR